MYADNGADAVDGFFILIEEMYSENIFFSWGHSFLEGRFILPCYSNEKQLIKQSRPDVTFHKYYFS